MVMQDPMAFVKNPNQVLGVVQALEAAGKKE
jgi:hypothetical protein